MISNVWIINRTSGICILHKNYGPLGDVDPHLFGGMLTAILNLSIELTSGELIKSILMGSHKFFYKVSKDFIIVISAEELFDEDDVKPILDRILDRFIKLGFAEKTLSNPDMSLIDPFGGEITLIVQEKQYYIKIPYLLMNPTKKEKFALDESRIITLCDGNHTIEKISKETGLSIVSITEIIQKYLKKKVLGMKRLWI